MQERHQDRKRYFNEQATTTERYVIPYVEDHVKIDNDCRVLEIGCGEGGNMKPFLDRGCQVTGIDISKKQLDKARAFYDEMEFEGKLTLIDSDILKVNIAETGTFDLIFLRDVIEHIPNQEKFMAMIGSFLKPNGKIFFGFPPWQMPFGGHQQMCTSVLSKTPWIHILPKSVYRALLTLFKEPDRKIDALLEHVDTGITIERFHKIARNSGFSIAKNTYYLINPNYEAKYGLQPRKQFHLISLIPYFRNFVTTCYYCILSK
jgi:SAM-dependent methyltransferase